MRSSRRSPALVALGLTAAGFAAFVAATVFDIGLGSDRSRDIAAAVAMGLPGIGALWLLVVAVARRSTALIGGAIALGVATWFAVVATVVVAWQADMKLP